MIAVTGADGFIGKNLVDHLKKHTDSKIISVDFNNCDYNPWDFLSLLSDSKEIKTIYHNGACSSTTEQDPFYISRVNTDYTCNLIKICAIKNINLIYASSASVYGDGPFGENDIKTPKNLYAKSKSIIDDYADMFLSERFQLVSLRYFNVYGRNESHKGDMASVMYKFKTQVDSGKINLFEGSHSYRRDFVHIDDVISINMFFYENTNYSGIYNVGTGMSRSYKDVADIFCKRYGVKINLIDFPEHLNGKYQKFTESDNSKLNKLYNHKYLSLEEGINKYMDFLENE